MLAHLCFHFQTSLVFLELAFFPPRLICSSEVPMQPITTIYLLITWFLIQGSFWCCRKFILTVKSELVVPFVSQYRTREHLFRDVFVMNRYTRNIFGKGSFLRRLFYLGDRFIYRPIL